MASKNKDYDLKSISRISNQSVPIFSTDESGSKLAAIDSSVISKSLINRNSTGIVLNEAPPKVKDFRIDSVVRPNKLSSQYSASFAPPSPPKSALDTAFVIKPSIINRPLTIHNSASSSNPAPDLSRRPYSRSDLLGGSLTLNDLNEPAMPPLARAERALWSRMGDPLAPLPQIWREPMRKALIGLVTNTAPPTGGSQLQRQSLSVDTARIVHVPSAMVKKPADVPLALQSDGTVDILNTPDDPAVVEEIKTWSSKQQLPAKGRLAPAVIHLHPLPPPQHSGAPSQAVGSEASAKVTESPAASPVTQQVNPEQVSRQARPKNIAAPAEQAAAFVAPEANTLSPTTDGESAAEGSGGQP